MTTAVGLPSSPLLRLRCCASETLRAILQRKPIWGHAVPIEAHQDGERGVLRYRAEPQSFWIEVQFKKSGDDWIERDFTIVPGGVVALRLSLDEVDPQAITAGLGIEPSRAWRKGEAGPSRRVRDEGLWIHEVADTGCLWPEEKVAELLALLQSHSRQPEVLLAHGVQWAGIAVHYRGCQERMGGLALDQDALAAMAALGLQLDVELFAD